MIAIRNKYLNQKSKVEQLKSIIEMRRKETQNLKILIFSDYSNALNNFIPVLNELNLKFSQITGSAATISKRVRQFKSTDALDSIDCLLNQIQNIVQVVLISKIQVIFLSVIK